MIVLIRHGETVWNTEGRFQGRLDSPLTPHGLKQADQIGLRLAEELAGNTATIEAYVSPLGRAKQTAARIAKFARLTFQDEPRLAEVSLGSWDGMTPYEIEMEYPGVLQDTESHDWHFRSPDGETFEAAYDRARSWLSSLTTPAVAVSHGLMSRLIRGAYLGLTRHDMLRLPVPQTGFFILRDQSAHHVE